MNNIHFLNSNLNNTTLKKNVPLKVNNKVDYNKLKSMLKANYDKNVKNIKYQGYGINGEYFSFEKDKGKYICKCIEYSPSNLKQIQKELSILYKIQSNKYATS